MSGEEGAGSGPQILTFGANGCEASALFLMEILITAPDRGLHWGIPVTDILKNG